VLDGIRSHGENLVRRSTDNGSTWSKVVIIRSHGEPANHPIRLKDGVIAMPYDNSSLLISRDDGRTWQSRGRDLRGTDDIRPGKSGPLIAGYHAPIVQLADGRLMAFSRLDAVSLQERFRFKMPVNYSSDLGET
jgi:sulfatase modifying factor 1